MNPRVVRIEAVAPRRSRRFSTRFRAAAAAIAAAMAVVAILPGYAAAAAPIRLQPEQRATLHVNQLAVIELPKRPPISIGGAGESLVLMRRRNRRDKTLFLYRAVKAGNHVFVVSPDNLPERHCISCVTEHYFVTVVR